MALCNARGLGCRALGLGPLCLPSTFDPTDSSVPWVDPHSEIAV